MHNVLQRLCGHIFLGTAVILFAAPFVQAQTTAADLISADSPLNELTDGGFESGIPSFWASSGDGATWSNEQSRTPEYSLKLSGAGEAAWTMAEAVQKWTPGFPGAGNPELVAGVWVYTDNVNTAPASDADKFQIVFEFFSDATQTVNVLGDPIVIDVPQDNASTNGWVKVTSESLGAITFPGEKAALSARLTVRKGEGATGTVYFDDFFLVKADPEADGWAGSIFNSNVDVSSNAYYWWNGFDAEQGDTWPDSQPHFVTVSTADAYEGDHSLRIESNGSNQDEAIAISERVPVDGPMLVAFRVKHEDNALEDSIGVGTNNLGIRVLGFNNLTAGTAGYDVFGELQLPLNGKVEDQPFDMLVPVLGHETTSKAEGADWTQYAFVVYPREEATSIEVRLSYWNNFTGVSYWDDLFVAPVSSITIGTAVEDDPVDRSVPEAFRLQQNYPNPFNPSTTIAFDLNQSETVSLGVFNVLGQKVATLLDHQTMAAGTQTVRFDASELPSGLYLYVLEVNGHAVSKKMALLK